MIVRMEIKPGDLVRTRHGDLLRTVEYIDNAELGLWKCDNGTVYIEDDLTPVAQDSASPDDAPAP